MNAYKIASAAPTITLQDRRRHRLQLHRLRIVRAALAIACAFSGSKIEEDPGEEALDAVKSSVHCKTKLQHRMTQQAHGS